jgi:hypothetical protein
VAGPDTGQANVNLLGTSLYTTYLFPFEATAALLIIAVVGAVVLARRPPSQTPSAAADTLSGPGSDEDVIDATGEPVVEGRTSEGDDHGGSGRESDETAGSEVGA